MSATAPTKPRTHTRSSDGALAARGPGLRSIITHTGERTLRDLTGLGRRAAAEELLGLSLRLQQDERVEVRASRLGRDRVERR